MLLVGVLVVAVVGVLVVALLGSGRPNYSCADLLEPQAGATVESPIVTPNLGNSHFQVGARLSYALCPPASGPHYSSGGIAPVPPRFYGPDSNVGPGSWVHNLEHGFAVALYRCVDGTCPSDEELDKLRQFVQQGPPTDSAAACSYQSKVLAARFDEMATPYALLAWDRVLLLDAFDLSTALEFANRWIEETGPEPTRC